MVNSFPATVFACDTVSEEAISIIVDDMPEFPGDLPGWLHEMTSRFVESEGMKGRKPYRVVVRIVVEKDGSVTNPEILRGADSVLNAEALRVVRSMPRWKPGKRGEKNADFRLTIPINFRISSYKQENIP